MTDTFQETSLLSLNAYFVCSTHAFFDVSGNHFLFQDVDLVVAGMTISVEREEVVDFSYLFWEEKLGMLTGTVSGYPFYMLRPIHAYIWLSIMAVVVIAATVAACCETLALKIQKTATNVFLTPLDFLRYTSRAMWNQGGWNNEIVLMFQTQQTFTWH